MQSTSDPRDKEVVFPARDPQVGDLATPVNSSGWTMKFINNLPAYRKGLSAARRGLEVGMAHGYFLFGPFTWYNPLRNSSSGDFVGLLEAISLVIILTFALSLYAAVLDINVPVANVTTPEPPKEFYTQQGWRDFSTGFVVGGVGGAVVAYLVYQVVKLIIF
ncbi:MAG TPA: photosystem I reaction center subunit XI [Halomicronema sp.]